MQQLQDYFKISNARLITFLSIFVLIVNVIFSYFYFRNHSVGEPVIQQSQSDKVMSLITVEIAGEVQKPGVYDMPIGSRVNHLVQIAGGYTKNANINYLSQNLNLAKILSDQDKIFVPSFDSSVNSTVINKTVSQVSVVTTSLVSLNTASLDQLIALPAIGEVSAKKIIANRPYSNNEELVFKKILGKSQYQKIKDLISL